MPQESMTPRERWQAVLTHHAPDRVPMDYWSTPEFSARLIQHMGLARGSERALVRELTRGERRAGAPNQARRGLREALKRLHVDFVVTVGPRYTGPRLPDSTDVFGCRYRSILYGTGEYSEVIENPLAKYTSVADIEANYTWPSPDWYDYTTLPAQIAGWEAYPIQGGGSEPFLIYKNLRGQEQAMIDLVDHPDIVHYCLDHLFELAYINTQRIFESLPPGTVLLSYVAEDMGGQDNLMFSRKHIRTFLLPRMKRIMDLVHQGGAYVFHHNDGNCRAILPDMLDAGIDALNPIQWRSRGMEREGLVADFGARVIFHGAMDNQYTLPFGTVEEVRQEVQDNLRIFQGRYILAPCHNIQPLTPVENVLAMYEEGYQCGWG